MIVDLWKKHFIGKVGGGGEQYRKSFPCIRLISDEVFSTANLKHLTNDTGDYVARCAWHTDMLYLSLAAAIYLFGVH